MFAGLTASENENTGFFHALDCRLRVLVARQNRETYLGINFNVKAPFQLG